VLWWVALHALAVAGIPWLGLDSFAAVGLALLLGAHALVRRRFAPPPELLLDAAGFWSVPALGLAGLTVGPDTRYTTFWVRLSLVGVGGGLDILLLADQLDAESWRTLQVRLRRGSAVGGSFAARSERGRDLR
jgi:hypothetical protein